MSKRLPVLLTEAQADQVRWALDPMDDFWCTPDGAYGRDGPEYPSQVLPYLEAQPGRYPWRLWLSVEDDINTDLLYRLEVQLQDMAAEEGTAEARGTARAGLNAAQAIRRRKPSLTDQAVGGGWI